MINKTWKRLRNDNNDYSNDVSNPRLYFIKNIKSPNDSNSKLLKIPTYRFKFNIIDIIYIESLQTIFIFGGKINEIKIYYKYIPDNYMNTGVMLK